MGHSGCWPRRSACAAPDWPPCPASRARSPSSASRFFSMSSTGWHPLASLTAMQEGTTDGYAHALRREILRSEQQRMRALPIILAVLLVATVTGSVALSDLTQRLVPGGTGPLLPWLAPR